jgi:hypothetical protein
MASSKSFIWRKQIIEDKSLHSTTKLVAMILHYHMDNDTCECFPSEALIAKEASLTERCVVNHIKKLKQNFYLSIRKEKGGQGWNRNCYTGILHPEFNLAATDKATESETKGYEYKDQNVMNEVHTNSSINSTYNSDNQSIENNSSVEIDTFFNQFWEMYPQENRYSETKCRNLWRKNKLEEIGEKIIDGLKSAKLSKQWCEGYVPSIFKFIDEEQWQKVYKKKTSSGFRGRVK